MDYNSDYDVYDEDDDYFQVGDIVRKYGGWTPMAIVRIEHGTAYARYCGESFDWQGSNPHDDSAADYTFIRVVNPYTEFAKCNERISSPSKRWQNRLNTTQWEQLRLQEAETETETETEQKGKSTMKSRTELLNIAALTSDEVTTISVRLGDESCRHIYTFLCKRTLAVTIMDENTPVVVETKKGMTVGFVQEIHPEVTIENMDDYRMRWAILKVPMEELAALNKWQETVADKLNMAQRKVTKQSALQALGLGADEVQALPALGTSE